MTDAEQLQTWSALESRIGHLFTDRAVLAQAMTHRSYANENREPGIVDNERLEFLGDAVLDLVVGQLLMERDSAATEGELSRLRAELVSAPALARLAGELRIGECLLLGRGEARSGGRDKDSLLADAFEALLGAVFLDAGYAAARQVTERLFRPMLVGAVAPAGQDYKTRLQEKSQIRRQVLPEYRLVAMSGPAHQRDYQVRVLLDGVELGCGSGPTKKRAEQEAARQALAFFQEEGADD